MVILSSTSLVFQTININKDDSAYSLAAFVYCVICTALNEHAYTRTHACSHSCTHACTHSHTYTHTYTHTYSHTHILTHSLTHSRTHALTHTFPHINRVVRERERGNLPQNFRLLVLVLTRCCCHFFKLLPVLFRFFERSSLPVELHFGHLPLSDERGVEVQTMLAKLFGQSRL